MKLSVKSAVIDWQVSTLEITDTDGSKHTLPLDKDIAVTMIGYPDREEKTLPARNLGQFMSQGYIIEEISFERTLFSLDII